jgi:hypothetical protein
VVDEVWALYKYVLHKAARVPNTMVEWDDNIPEFDVLYAELGKAKLAAKAAAADAQNFAPLPDLAVAGNHIANIITPLAEAQNTMQNAILQGTDINPDAWIRSKENFAPASQLAVYINAYRYRLYDVTAEDFPVLKKHLGDANFDQLIKNFVNTAHSAHFNIGRYATQLPNFVEAGFAREIAVLENAISQLADPAETTPLEPKHLDGISPEMLMEMRLYPRDALQLFAFEYPVNEYYRLVMDEKSPALPAPEKTFVAVFRHEDVVWRMDLEAAEYQILSALFAGKTVGEALKNVDESAAAKLSEYFSRWIRNGLLRADEYINEQQKRKLA